MDDNPYDRRRRDKAVTGKRGRIAESRTANRLGGKETPASGAGGIKGDITLDDYLVENKSTVNGSLSLKVSWLQKISHEARGKTKRPALSVQFTDDSGKPIKDGAWVMIPEKTFKEISE